MSTSLERLQSRLALAPVDALLVTDPKNVTWLTGFTGSYGYALLRADRGVFITDSRYTLQAQAEVTGLEVISFASPRSMIDLMDEQIAALKVEKLGFEPSVTYQTWESWTRKITSCEWVAQPDLLPPLRMVKTPEELSKIRAACQLADQCMEHIVGMLQPGVSEYDIGLAIEFFFRRAGAGIAFDPIVASGLNSAKPHGRASEKKLVRGDFVTLDFGATLDGYNSDITRTFVIGPASDRQKLLYARVLEAQVAAVDALRPGANGRDVEALARKILDQDDLAQYFGHGLGHGLGADVHDYGRLTSTVDQPIEVGQVWTVEPGVYINDFGGLRIEDDVVVTEGEPEILTHFPKNLMEL
ncbi:MAG TPA: Xaa-Pro peptidase family protein [Fimbriimonadaceae bacterium]|nr:Xaa-Pro peptidase family protein [Fimbriimonadaceae bacterium]HRJ32431.1 Xaa-Pro peptidase family protein [Fimbriimonadaceae bacterium]